jgi:hypothetical protein
VAANDPFELMYGRTWGVPYAFTVFANGGAGIAESALGANAGGATTEVTNCTFTMGYWKNHAGEWPVASLLLGSVVYSKSQLLLILGTSVRGNGLVSLAHQLIAAKLNLSNGATPTGVAAALATADALISDQVVPPVGSGYLDPGTTSSITQALDDFNNGVIGPGHCGDTPARGASWGAVKLRYR